MSALLNKLKAFHSTAARLKEDDPESLTELSKLIAVTTFEGGVTFHGVKLHGACPVVQQALKNNQSTLVDKVFACVKDRFDDLKTVDAMKGVRLLNSSRDQWRQMP